MNKHLSQAWVSQNVEDNIINENIVTTLVLQAIQTFKE